MIALHSGDDRADNGGVPDTADREPRTSPETKDNSTAGADGAQATVPEPVPGTTDNLPANTTTFAKGASNADTTIDTETGLVLRVPSVGVDTTPNEGNLNNEETDDITLLTDP